MIRKDEVVEWFQKQSGAGRLDTMCTLLDMCLPFEIRFLGSVMENLGRRDFHELNGVSHSANGFLSGKNSVHSTTASAKEALYNVLLNSPGVTGQAPANPSGTNTTIAPVFSNKDVCSSSPSTFSGSEVPAVSLRQIPPEVTADPTHKVSSSPLLPQSPKRPHGQNTAIKDEKNLPNSVDEEEGRHAETWKANIADKPVTLTDAKSPSPCFDKNILEDETLRRRLILYLSLLTATNRECANAYYKVLLDSQNFLEAPGWLAELSSDTLEEYCLLFTIAVYHPVFTFEQKRILSEILQKFAAHSELVQRNIEDEETKFYAAPVQSFIGGFDPKIGPYYMFLSPPMAALGWSPPANMNYMNIGGNPSVEEIQRVTPNTAPTNSMTCPVPHFPPFPMFIHNQPGNRSVPSQHQTTAPVHHQFSPQTFPFQTPVSPQSSMGVGPAPFPYPCAYHTPMVAPPSAASRNHIPSGQVVPPVYSVTSNEGSGTPATQPQGLSAASAGGASSLSLSSKSPSLPQLSPQTMEAVNVSCRSNSTTGLFSNTASSHTNVHVRDSSVGGGIYDNESEENYESTEDSPYASPPQSLTPSRSHSPLPISNLSRSQTSTTHFTSSDTSSNQHDHHRSSALPTSENQGLSKRSVSCAATSISPPPRSNRNHGSTKISQVVQVQSPTINSYNVEAAISCLDHGKFHKSGTLPSASNPLALTTAGTIPAVSYSKAQDNQAALSFSSTINGINNDAETKRITQHSCKSEYMIPSGVILQGNTQLSNGQGHDSATSFQSTYNPRRQHNHISNSSSTRRPVPISQVTCTSGQYFPQASSPPSIRSVQVPKVGHIQAAQPYNFYGSSSTPVYYQPQSAKSMLQHQQGPKQTSSNVPTGRMHAAQANGSKRDSPNYALEVKSGLVSSSPAISIDNAPASGINPQNLNGFDNMQVPSGSTNFTHEPSRTSKPSTTLPNLAAASNSGPGLPRNRYILDIGGAGQELRMEPTSQFFGTVEDIVDGLNRPKKSCYNCGSHSHVGLDCREKTMEDMTKGIYRINFESTEPTLIAEKQKE